MCKQMGVNMALEAQKNNLKHLLYNAESNNISAVSLDPEEISKIELNAFAAFGGNILQKIQQ